MELSFSVILWLSRLDFRWVFLRLHTSQEQCTPLHDVDRVNDSSSSIMPWDKPISSIVVVHYSPGSSSWLALFPTHGRNDKTCASWRCVLFIWDFCGHESIRTSWVEYFVNTEYFRPKSSFMSMYMYGVVPCGFGANTEPINYLGNNGSTSAPSSTGQGGRDASPSGWAITRNWHVLQQAIMGSTMDKGLYFFLECHGHNR